jgi:uncharacterized membrane protein
MHRNRLEAFSDGVLAIIITIMVLELKIPRAPDFASLIDLLPKISSYILSFVYIAIYWNNHHHLLHTVHQVNGSILWANMHLLFWLSVVPFATAWSGESHFAATPTAVYGVILFMAALSYWILTRTIIASHGKNSVLAKAVGKDFKGNISVVLYAAAVPSALWFPAGAMGIYVLVALIWLIPDRRIEKHAAAPQ